VTGLSEQHLECRVCGMKGANKRNMKRRCANSYEVKNLMIQGGHCWIEDTTTHSAKEEGV